MRVESGRGERGATDERPQINYDRCTYCGLCVDVCPTGSLSLSQDFIHNDVTPESFVAVPQDEKAAPELFDEDTDDFTASLIHRRKSDAGYKSELAFTFAHLDGHAKEMEVVPPEERVRSFVEMVRGFTREQALAEASRCFECRVGEEACPAHMDIADYIRDIWAEDYHQAARDIYKTNPLPEVCGRVCTHNCEKACAMSHRGDPVSIRWLKRYAMDQIPLEDYEKALGTPIVKPTGKRVAIVGAGPPGGGVTKPQSKTVAEGCSLLYNPTLKVGLNSPWEEIPMGKGNERIEVRSGGETCRFFFARR